MNNYLDMVAILRNDPEFSERIDSDITEMDIIFSQALLMDAGSATFKAIKAGELAEILAGLVVLAYSALEVLAVVNKPVEQYPVEVSSDYLMITIMRRLSQKIAACASGDVKDYYALFLYCAHLATDFINADFNNAVRFYHEWRITQGNSAASHANSKLPDLTDYLFE